MREIALQYDVIERGVPMPQDGKGGRAAARNWEAMEVGDCVLKKHISDVVSVRAWGKLHGRTFKVRKRREYPYGYRIWRVS